MSARLGVLFVLLLSACVSAKSTGSALVSKTSGHSSQIDAQESPFLLDNYAKRKFLQEPEGRCSDCSILRRDAYNKTLGAWLLDDLVLKLIDFSIQCVVSCANASETVMLASNRTLIPNGTITIDKPMTITGFHEDVATSEGTYPAARNKTVISCSKGSNQGIFEITYKESGGVIIANFEIRDCSLEGDDSPMVIQNCSSKDLGVQIHHLDFVKNKYESPLVAFDVDNSSTCGTSEMINVAFKNNLATGSSAIVRHGYDTVMKNIRVEDNKQSDDAIERALFVFTGSGTQNDSVILNRLIAKGNRLPLLKAESSFVEIFNSDFIGNNLGKQGGSMFQFSSESKIVLRNCRFEDNIGAVSGMITLESDTSTKIINSILTNNTKFGSVVFGTGSELSIWGSNFSENNGTSNGGVIHLANSIARLYGTFFEDNNSGGNGGVGYAIESSSFIIRKSKFVNNIALAGGCFYIEDSTVDVRKSSFYANKAGVDGGAIRVERGGVVCEDSTFEENSSSDEGGAIHIENAKYVALQSVRFTSRDAAFGSVVRIDKSRTNVTLKDVHFRGGVVELTGAALYIDDSDVTIDGATFTNNTAPYGGAIYAQKFDITIRHATFLNNSASVMGGAISGDNGNITLEYTTFEENHSYLGGALQFYNTTFKASEIVLLNNSASEGGGLLCKDSSVTIRPRKKTDPRIPLSAEFNPDYSFGIFARNNTGIDSGGAVDAKDSNVAISYGTFSTNIAPEGGAIQVTSSELSSIDIFHSSFEENVAYVRGGGVAVRSANEGNVSMRLSSTNFFTCIAPKGGAVFLASVNAVIEDCKFVNNNAAEGGAALFRKNARVIENNETETDSADISITIKDSLFKENNATADGGAIMLKGEIVVDRRFISGEEGSKGPVYANKGFNVFFDSVNISKNKAYSSGGGVCGNAIEITMKNVKVRENKAPQGGGLFLRQAKGNIYDSSIESNQAESSGGGIMIATQSEGMIQSTRFVNNSVTKEGDGGGLSLSGSTVRGKKLILERNKADSGGGISLVPGSKRNSREEKPKVDSQFLCFGCTFSKNKASKSGGGLNIQSQDGGIPVMAQLENCQFEHNSASVYGGGIHFVRPFNQTNCPDWTSCGHLVILGTSFIDNKADRSGGSLLSNDRDRVIFNCSDSEDDTSSLKFINETIADHLKKDHNLEGFCSQWVYGESCSTKISPLVSSYASKCIIKDVREGNWSEIKSNSIQINGTVPGERLPDIYIECYDEYGNVVTSGDDGFKATLKSKEKGSSRGIFVTDLQDGTGKFSGVRNPPKERFNSSYSYELDIFFSLEYLDPIKVLMNVRECRINEQKEGEGVQCKRCDATQYNFNPMSEHCKHCDDTLDCSETYVFPKGNFWHWSPCHVPAQKCLTTYACEETADLPNKFTGTEFGNISTALKNFSCDFSNASIEEYQKLQCQEGYEGVLCGSCQKDYGRSLSFACTKCEHPVVSILILVSVCGWLAAITAITIRGSMTIEERLTAIRKQLCDIASHRRFGFEESLPEEDETEEQGERRENKNTKIIQYRSKALKRTLTGASSSTDASYMIGCNLPTTSVTTTAEAAEKIDNLTSAQLAKWKLCEVFKVTINFLQAISVAAVINVEWTTYMLTMFDLSAFAGGASTALVTRAIHCFPWWNGTRYATYIGLVSGLLVPTFVILCMVAFFGFVTYKTSKGLYYFVKRSALATLAICYFTYLSITKVAVMVFYCIEVHTDDDFSSDKETYYWALDTSIQCADPDHKGLMAFGGILFVLFSVGFPLVSAFVLVLCRKGDGSRDPQWMTDILGFLYRAYKREFVYWESTVMLRKALLSAIAVFSYHLGGHSQGLLASCILSVCLFLQAIYKPYRVEFGTVNNIESLSLLISGITFTLAQFFMKDRTNEAVKVALAVFLMISIIVFFVYLMVRMWVCLIDVLRTDLRVRGALLDEDENSMIVVGSLVVSMLGLSSHSRDSDDDDEDDELAAAELGSMRGKKNDDTMSDKSA